MKRKWFLALAILINGCCCWSVSCAKDGFSGGSGIVSIPDKTVQPKAFSTPDPSIPEGWVLFPSPKENSAARDCANRAIENERKIENENGNVKISKYVYKDDEQTNKLPAELRKQILRNRNLGQGLGGYLHIERYENGWLIGSDAGEWGGKLFWFSETGNLKTELLKDNIRGIAATGGEVFILSGMAHGGIDDGKIYKLTKDEQGNLKIRLINDLKTQPQAYTVENNQSILIVLNNRILRLKTTGEIETLKEVNFNSLYPNSTAVSSAGVIYIGMRLFIVRLVPGENGYAEEWLVAPNCQSFVEKDYRCVCQSDKTK
ncbi:MAG TPA: hypothetical protein VF604_16025 [Pyrinomonadaceae bacterium]|jgi:hypothetical protein